MAYIEISPAPSRVTVRWRGHVVADSARALELREGSYPPVLYVPREDADKTYLAASDRHTTCPHKGMANYFHLKDEAGQVENAVRSYETPKAEVAEIAGHIAFYADKVEIARA